MKFVNLVVITICAICALACGNTTTVNTPPTPSPGASPPATSTPTPDSLAKAREYYADTCANCHQDNGEGGMVKIEGKRLNVPALTKGHALGHTDEQLAKQISNGGDGMPAFKDKLTPEEIDDLVRYVRTQFQAGAKAKLDDTQSDVRSVAPTDLKNEKMDMKEKSKDTKEKPMDMSKH